MLTTYRKIIGILDTQERLRAAGLMGLFFLLGIFETIGVASIMPFMAVVANPETIETNSYLNAAYHWVGAESPNQFLIILGVVVFVALFLSLAMGAGTNWALFRFTEACNYRISIRLLGTYFSRPYVWFLSQHSADLGKTVLSEVEITVSHAVLPALNIISKTVVVALLMSLVIATDPMIALASISLLTSLYLTVFFFVRNFLGRIGREMFAANELRYKIAQESLGGIKDVKVSGLERSYTDRYAEPARRFASRQAAYRIVGIMPKYLMEATAFGGILAIVLFMLLNREGGLGTALPVIAVYALAGYRLLPALQALYHDFATMKFGTHVLTRIHHELTRTSSSAPLHASHSPELSELLRPKHLIELRDVTFQYPGAARPALQSVSIQLKANSTIGLVGATGAGKTTAVDLILGLIEPDSGELTVDGQTIDRSNLRSWQRNIGYVPQSIFLVDDTIAANIAFGERPNDIDHAAVERAARAAELHGFVMNELPDGYLTIVGERGVRLSGGQRQRIGIARALYRNPSVLVFDEATSALDNLTEAKVMSSVDKLAGTRTIILVAHRLSTIRNCNSIVFMDQGRVAASGTYDQLKSGHSAFRAMADAT